jgi:hypothetical protein
MSKLGVFDNKIYSDDGDDDILDINVGGRIFTCRRSTLCLDGESRLATIFKATSAFRSLDSSGRPFLDRDGESFAIILDYLRRGKRLVGKANLTDNVYDMLLDEVLFYGLHDLHHQLVEQRQKETMEKAVAVVAVVEEENKEDTNAKKKHDRLLQNCSEQKCHIVTYERHKPFGPPPKREARAIQSCIEQHAANGWKVQCVSLLPSEICGGVSDQLLIVFVKEKNCHV